MFGSGDMSYVYSDWPFNVIPRHMKLYYMIGLGYHFEDTVHHLFHPAGNDFFEMLLHHYITVMLVIGSYMTGNWNIGINVMIQMDNGDCVGGLIKAFMDFSPTPFVLVNYSAVVFSWMYFRVFVFAYEVIWQASMFGKWESDTSGSAQTIYQMLLIGLLTLNVYWTVLFWRMGYRYATRGEIKDIQNPVEDTKSEPQTHVKVN